VKQLDEAVQLGGAPSGSRRTPPPLRSRPLGRALALALASGVIGAGIVAGLLFATGVAGDQTTVSSVETLLPAEHGSGQASLNAPAIYSVAAPGVVDITASGIHSSSRGLPLTPPGQSEVATGTGFEIDSSGDILTAAHVVAGASSITVALDDGSTHRATVLGVDRSTDVAVLKIDPSGATLHPLPLGSSQALVVGDPLAVIGDPLNFDRSLSTGVVSALNRTIQAPNGFTIANAIQTDAAIDPGNSGGPVLNARGQVVGITDQIATGESGSDTFTGVGFAVPIDDVKAELSQLQRGVQVSHAYLGVGIAQTTGADGALIGSVASSGPGAAAGLRAGDLVTAADGKAIHDANGLVAAIQATQPGQKLSLAVQRGSQHLNLTATLGNQPGTG
jgi:S1-C subfamily serine protease